LADKKRFTHKLDRTEPSLPPWQSAARPGPVIQPGAKQAAKLRKARGFWPGELGRRLRPQQSAALRSKPLRLASKRKRGAANYLAVAIRACIVITMLMLPLLLAGSAPARPLPNVESRFEDWKQAHNENAVNPLPRRTSGQ